MVEFREYETSSDLKQPNFDINKSDWIIIWKYWLNHVEYMKAKDVSTYSIIKDRKM